MSQIGPVLCGDKEALLNGPEVKAMLIQGTNPMLVAPDLGKVKQGLLRDDLFVCVHEQFMTETAQHADLVLPATTFVEQADLYTSYGHTFMQFGDRIIEPLGKCRNNHQVICELAKRVGAKHRGFDLSEKDLIDKTLEDSNYPPTHQFDHQHFIDCSPSFEDAHFLSGFNWPDKKFRFSPDWESIGTQGKTMPSLPDFWNVIDQRDNKYPLKLVAAPSRGFLNSSFNNTPSSLKREKKPWLKIHPETAATYDVENGQPVLIGNSRGSVTVMAQYMENLQADTVIVEGIWSATAFPEKIGINILISSERAAPNGGAVFHDTAVWIKPVSAS